MSRSNESIEALATLPEIDKVHGLVDRLLRLDLDNQVYTGCSLNIMFFSKHFQYFATSPSPAYILKDTDEGNVIEFVSE